MKKTKLLASEESWRSFHAFLVFLILGLYLLFPFMPEHCSQLYASYGKALFIAAAALYFWYRRFDGCFELRLVILYALWFFITRILNTDFYLTNDFDLTLGRVLCVLVMAAGLLLERKQRDRFFDVVIALYCGYFFLLSLISLYCCITCGYVLLPPENVSFGIDDYDWYLCLNYICFFGTNRTISAVWPYIGWCLMTYEFAKAKGSLWRIPIALAWLVFYLGIALSFSRTINIVFACSVGMLGLLLGLRYLKIKNRALLTAALTVLTAASLLIGYKSLDYSNKLSVALSDRIVSVMDREDGFVHYHPVNNEHFIDFRDTKSDVKSLSGRSGLYSAVFKVLRDEPDILLRGRYSFKAMDGLNREFHYPNTPISHAHNYLLQVLFLTGIVGFLLVLLFSVLTVRRMIMVFFAPDNKVLFADRLLTIPLAGSFIYSMVEVMIFTNSADYRSPCTDARELMFFVIAGVFLAVSYEVFPSVSGKK